MKRRFSGFTLIELIVVIAVIILLVSLLFPSLRSARLRARRVVDMNNLRQFTLTCINYAADNQGWYPSGNIKTCPYYGCPSYGGANNDPPNWMNYCTTLTLMNSYGLGTNQLSCLSYAPEFSAKFPYPLRTLTPCASGGWPFLLGWYYHGNRMPNPPYNLVKRDQYGNPLSPTQPYHRPRSLTSQSSSRTLVTCMAWYGGIYESPYPHSSIDDKSFTAPPGVAPIEIPTMIAGMNFGWTDGSVHWAKPREWQSAGAFYLP